MAEVLVIGKKISEMGLVNEITGEEKIPTSASGDKAVTTGQLLTYVNNNGAAQWGRIVGDISDQTDLQNIFSQQSSALQQHVNDEGNPHNVTANQVGLGNVNNTSDLDKPISLAVQQELDRRIKSVNGRIGDITLSPEDIGYPTLSLLDERNKGANRVIDLSGLTQQQINDNALYTVENTTDLVALPERVRSRTVLVKNTGRLYRYDSERSAINDTFHTVSGWVLLGSNDKLSARLVGILGDGTDESSKLKNLFDAAYRLNLPVDLEGLYITTAPLTLSGHLKIIGRGGLKLADSSNTTLNTTAYDLRIDGDITLDQNMASNSSGTIGSETHCTIKHTGDVIELRKVSFKPSKSINIVSRASKKAIFKDLEVDGGMIGIFAPTPNAKVEVIGGIYKNSTLYDNIQILNGGDVTIERVTSLNSARSGIIVNNSSKRVRMIGNFATGAKVDGANQGGWGIVCSQNTQDSVVIGNICVNNQRGGITIDTYPDSGASVDNRVVVIGNVLGGLYNGVNGISGLVLNNAKHSNVTGNIIYSVAQGILSVDADHSNIHGNTVINTTEFFIHLVTSHNGFVNNNNFDGSSASGTSGAVRFTDTNNFICSNNSVRNLTGGGVCYRVGGNSKDWIIKDESVHRTVASSGWCFNIVGAGNTGGRILRNRIKASGVVGWQWYIYSDNQAQFSSHENELEISGTGYIYQGSNVTAGDDIINSVKNVWATAPTGYKFRTGQVAVIGGVLKFWDGTTWL